MILFLKSCVKFLRGLILLSSLLFLVTFMLSNRESIKIYFHPFPIEIETKIFVAMFSFFLLGLFFGLILCSKKFLQNSITNFQSKNKIKKLEKKLGEKSGD